MDGCTKKSKGKRKQIHFTEDVSLDDHTHSVVCQFESEKECLIDLGLLSSLHTYQVHCQMPHQLGNEIQIPPLQSPAIEIINLDKIGESAGHTLTFQVKCMEGSDLNETIYFENLKDEKLTVKIVSRVMPLHLGTPSLKAGIKLLQGAPDAMSDATDWNGFDDTA